MYFASPFNDPRSARSTYNIPFVIIFFSVRSLFRSNFIYIFFHRCLCSTVGSIHSLFACRCVSMVCLHSQTPISYQDKRTRCSPPYYFRQIYRNQIHSRVFFSVVRIPTVSWERYFFSRMRFIVFSFFVSVFNLDYYIIHAWERRVLETSHWMCFYKEFLFAFSS